MLDPKNLNCNLTIKLPNYNTQKLYMLQCISNESSLIKVKLISKFIHTFTTNTKNLQK